MIGLLDFPDADRLAPSAVRAARAVHSLRQRFHRRGWPVVYVTLLLAKLGVCRLVLTGMALESCVLATAIDANAREYEAAVVREAVAGQPPLRAAAFKVLTRSKAADVVALDRAVAWAARPPR